VLQPGAAYPRSVGFRTRSANSVDRGARLFRGPAFGNFFGSRRAPWPVGRRFALTVPADGAVAWEFPATRLSPRGARRARRARGALRPSHWAKNLPDELSRHLPGFRTHLGGVHHFSDHALDTCLSRKTERWRSAGQEVRDGISRRSASHRLPPPVHERRHIMPPRRWHAALASARASPLEELAPLRASQGESRHAGACGKLDRAIGREQCLRPSHESLRQSMRELPRARFLERGASVAFASAASSHDLPIEQPPLNRLRNVRRAHALFALEIRNRSRDPAHLHEGAR
jgi:hypothetical protein